MENIVLELVDNIVVVCCKTQSNTPKCKQWGLNLFEIDFSGTNVGFETALNILNLLYISKAFSTLEFVVSTEQGLFTYTPKNDVIPKTLYKLGRGVNTVFSIYLTK